MIAQQVHDPSVERFQKYWNSHAASYDREMAFFERTLFGGGREWVCSRASGDVLEVAIGTGRNLPLYPDSVRVTGIDFSPPMLDQARQRAATLGLSVDLRVGNAHALEFADSMFDSVVCAFSLCGIPDDRRAIAEMHRVLRPGGRLLLIDHIVAAPLWLRAIQWLLERVTVPLEGEHFRRRPSLLLPEAGFEIVESERSKLGIVERVSARKP